MRYVRFSEDQSVIYIDRKVEGITDLSYLMRNPTYQDWIEGLGQPNCDQDLRNWKVIGQFLQQFGNMDPKDVK